MGKDLEGRLNTVIAGDCIANLALIPDKSIDLIFADPPYWMQTEGELLRTNGKRFDGVEDNWDKFNTYKEYDEFSEKWLGECKRVLKPDGSIWVIGAFQNIYRVSLNNTDIFNFPFIYFPEQPAYAWPVHLYSQVIDFRILFGDGNSGCSHAKAYLNDQGPGISK